MFPFNSGHGKHFVKSYSNISDVQLLSLSPALFHAALGTEKTHFQVCKMQLLRVNRSIATTFYKPPVKGTPLENLGQSSPSPWFILLKGPMINILFLLFLLYLVPVAWLPACSISNSLWALEHIYFPSAPSLLATALMHPWRSEFWKLQPRKTLKAVEGPFSPLDSHTLNAVTPAPRTQQSLV